MNLACPCSRSTTVLLDLRQHKDIWEIGSLKTNGTNYMDSSVVPDCLCRPMPIVAIVWAYTVSQTECWIRKFIYLQREWKQLTLKFCCYVLIMVIWFIHKFMGSSVCVYSVCVCVHVCVYTYKRIYTHSYSDFADLEQLTTINYFTTSNYVMILSAN